MRGSMALSSGINATDTRSSEVEAIIASADIDTTFSGKKARYRGRRSTWPGALGLCLILAISVGGLTYYGIQLKNDTQNKVDQTDEGLNQRFGSGQKIADGRTADADEDIKVTNPASYEDKKCEQPNYLSKNGNLMATFKSGKEVVLNIKGVNWNGMEDYRGVPKGLWDGTRDGSTLYRIGEFLSGNKFNAVRIATSIDSVMRNIEPDESLINTNSNRALETTRYIKLLGSIIQGFGQFNIMVVINFQTLSSREKDPGLWYGTSIQLDDIKTAISNLAKELCNGKHFNLVGIDLKDAPSKGTWGDSSNTDWAAAAQELGNHLVNECPNWVAFVQGVQGSAHKDTYKGPEGDRSIKYKFWAGSDLSNVEETPIQLSVQDKVVYFPKYFTSNKLPYPFFFDSGEMAGEILNEYVESDDEMLRSNVEASMGYMFGDALESGNAVVLSSFGGLMGEADETEKKTSTRIIKVLIEQMKKKDKPLAGGFWWALNPDTQWDHALPDNNNVTLSGLVEETWRAANMDVLKGLKAMDTLTELNTVPCQN